MRNLGADLLCSFLGILNETTLLKVIFQRFFFANHISFKHFYFYFQLHILLVDILTLVLKFQCLIVKDLVVNLCEDGL